MKVAKELASGTCAKSSEGFSLWPTHKKRILSVLVGMSLFAIIFLPLAGVSEDLPSGMLSPIGQDESARTVSDSAVEGDESQTMGIDP